MGRIKRNIIRNSKFIIKYFNENNREVTPFMLEELLYLLEAIYMSIANEDRLYNEKFHFSNLGIINEKTYKKYKKFGKYPIRISTNRVKINEENEKYISFLFALFKDYTYFDLIKITRSEESPLYDCNYEIMINKAEVREWFKKIILFEKNKKL